MIGGILVTVNTNYQSHELEYILKQSDSTTLFLIDSYRDTSFYNTVRNIIPEVDGCKPGHLVCAKLPLMKNIVYIGEKVSTPGMFKFTDMINMGKSITDQELEDRMNSLDDQDVINMQYTSGTTGFPKGVMLTHHNLSLIHISEPTRLLSISYAVFCLKKKKNHNTNKKKNTTQQTRKDNKQQSENHT